MWEYCNRDDPAVDLLVIIVIVNKLFIVNRLDFLRKNMKYDVMLNSVL